MEVGEVMWVWIALASAIAFGTKLLGYLLPESFLEHRKAMAVMSSMTIGLLAALVAVNAVTSAREVVLDSRVLAVVAAAIALRLKAPFIVVVLVGAAVVALARLAGLP